MLLTSVITQCYPVKKGTMTGTRITIIEEYKKIIWGRGFPGKRRGSI